MPTTPSNKWANKPKINKIYIKLFSTHRLIAIRSKKDSRIQPRHINFVCWSFSLDSNMHCSSFVMFELPFQGDEWKRFSSFQELFCFGVAGELRVVVVLGRISCFSYFSFSPSFSGLQHTWSHQSILCENELPSTLPWVCLQIPVFLGTNVTFCRHVVLKHCSSWRWWSFSCDVDPVCAVNGLEDSRAVKECWVSYHCCVRVLPTETHPRWVCDPFSILRFSVYFHRHIGVSCLFE